MFVDSLCSKSGSETTCHFAERPWKLDSGGGDWALNNTNSDLRFELRSGDIASWDKKHDHVAERTEISDSDYQEKFNNDIWLSFDLKVDRGPKVTSKWLTLGQLKAKEDPGDIPASPPWAEELDAGDVFKIVVRFAQKPVTKNPPQKVLFTDSEFQRDRTYHLVYRFRYANPGGLIQAWRNGKQIVDYSGPVGYQKHSRSVFKIWNISRTSSRNCCGSLLKCPD